MGNGKFIVFEGIEGCGKSFQIKELQSFMLKNNIDNFLTEEQWEEDEIGKMIKRELRDKKDGISVLTLQHLFIANRSNHVDKIIVPNISMGKNILCDRYYMSTVVYGSSFSANSAADMDYFVKANSIFPKPDVVFYIDVSAEVAYQRLKYRQSTLNNEITKEKKQKERFDKLKTLKVLRQKYLELAKVYDGNWVTINGEQEREKVTAEIMDHYQKMF